MRNLPSRMRPWDITPKKGVKTRLKAIKRGPFCAQQPSFMG